ncbi:MAG TPA: GNAT family N-acetyltransferase [Actinomycetaceae bacterium]|nr:GNAT family N-acetyltransferase [Actinomycetaceae bacterium]
MTARKGHAAGLRIHVVTADDWASHRDLRIHMLTESPDAFWGRVDDVRGLGEADWRAAVSGDILYLQARDASGAALGTLGVLPDGERDVHLIAMYVRPTARGGGVGDLLLDASAVLALEIGRPRQLLEVAADNTVAIRLYERHGFTVLARAAARPEGGEEPLTMVRELPEALSPQDDSPQDDKAPTSP